MRRLMGLWMVLGVLLGAAPAAAVELPTGFTETTVWSGLANPTVIRFAPNGKVLVASKSGIIHEFDGLSDPTPRTYADLRSKVHDYWDRGLLGMALDPQFTSGRPYVYVLYAYDKAPNNPMQPRWGDTCPTPPGPTADGCVITGRLSRLSATGAETVLIEDFCQQYPSHSTGSLEFGPDGQLYVSAGDGASFNWADWGQDGNPVNPCGDPGASSAATSQGGAVRAQAFRRPAGQPVTLDGAILRVNPDTGAASLGNPAIADPDPSRRRIVAYGLRNPFRFTFRPGTGEIWSGDVGWDQFEEINRTPNIAQVRNYGWPCYEGNARMGSYDSLNINACETLYADGAGAHTAPYFAYHHADRVVPGERCPTGSSSISGLLFYTGSTFPAAYRDGLFFADYSRNCIWFAPKGADGLPDMSRVQTFASQASGPVWLTQGPDGALYYTDLSGGTVRRIQGPNSAPTARIAATPTSGPAPLTVSFDGTGSSDPEGQPLTYAWDFDGNGSVDSSAARPTHTYPSAGSFTARLRVTDSAGLEGTATQTITVGAAPSVTITAPSASTRWAVGDRIGFAASAGVPAANLTWSLALRHCSRTNAAVCHTHAVEDFTGVASGSFIAPDHEYPSHLELTVTARTAGGVTSARSVTLMPATAELTVASEPAGMEVSLGSESLFTPFTRTVLARSENRVSAAPTQIHEDAAYTFTRWSGASANGAVTAPPTGGATVTAHFTRPPRTSLVGTEDIGTRIRTAPPGEGAIYHMTGAVAGTATSLRVWLDDSSRASRAVLALYADRAVEAYDPAEPGALLGTATIERPVAGWNAAALPVGVPIVPGRWYWLAVLNAPDSTGTLAWADRAAAPRLGQNFTLEAFPRTWVTAPGSWHVDGHVSGGAWPDAAPDEPEPTPVATPTPPAPDATADPIAPPALAPVRLAPPALVPDGPRLVGAWGKTLRLKSPRTRFTLRAPRQPSAFTLTARVYVDRPGTILQRGSALTLTTRQARVGKRGARVSLPRKRWTRVAVTFDGTTIRTYRDGRLVQARRGGPLPRTSARIRVGGLVGAVKDIRLYEGVSARP